MTLFETVAEHTSLYARMPPAHAFERLGVGSDLCGRVVKVFGTVSSGSEREQRACESDGESHLECAL